MSSVRNSLNLPNIDGQIRYLLEWFREFSEMQKDDFLPVLVQKFGNRNYVNGLLPGMESIGNFENRRPSLFQCRMTLFTEWTENWSQDEKERFLAQLRNIDPLFMAKFEKETETKTSQAGIEEVNEDD